MAPKRTVVVVIAVAVGAVAAVLSYVFLHNAQTNAYNNAKLVPAYVVTKPIPAGLAGSDAVNGGYLAQKQIPAEVRPATAVTNLAVLQGKQAIAPFSQGQVLVSGMFVSPSQAAVTFSRTIPAGDVAVTISVDAVHGVANLPQPGDKVDLLVNLNGTESFMLQNVPILAVGQSTVGQVPAQQGQTTTATTTTNSSGLYTFAVRPSDAARIALAQQAGLDIYMLLVPPGNQVISSPASVSNPLAGPQAAG
ncbi:MAG TPA: Flp pilus assembly protein CpaB [Acidimicrobiales bacterium]|nr:Flp pilus assembly protein CpaB [Acidimicrobiales bacterium]